jgi:hypothetical protein
MQNLPSQPDDDLPDGLARELRATYGRTPAVPASVDVAVLREARAGFARRRRFRLAARVAAAGGAAAAAAAVLALGLPGLLKPGGPPDVANTQPATNATHLLMVASPPAAEDVDRDGKVDILDAFVVARLIEARETADRAYDVNGDGAVDRADVDRIALAAVDTSRTRRDPGAGVQ